MQVDTGSGNDSTPWKALPADLVKSIVPRLPITTIIQSHTISREFHSWLTSDSFLDEYTRVASHTSWLVSFHIPSVLCAYDPCIDTWLEIPSPGLSGALPVASSRGLICMRLGNAMSICNLVTGATSRFPQPPGFHKLFFWTAGMVSARGHGFKVVVAGCELVSDVSVKYKLTALVFDSRAWSWSRGGRTSLSTRVSRTRAMSQGGKLFVLDGKHELKAYDCHLGRWSSVDLPAAGLDSIRLVDRSGQLVLIARTEKTTICLWRLRDQLQEKPRTGTDEWEELDEMPESLSAQFFHKRFSCTGDGDVAYFTTTVVPLILVYRFSSRTWNWTRHCKHVTHPYSDVAEGLCFEPRLDISVCCMDHVNKIETTV